MSRWDRALSTKSAACIPTAAPWRPLSLGSRPECSLLRQRPLTCTCSFTAPSQLLGSLYWNNIGPEGASALAAILKETMISNLKCAATR